MIERPHIQLTIDVMDESHPTPCSPCVWVVLIDGRDGCATSVDYYPSADIPARLQEFLAEIDRALAADPASPCQEANLHEITAPTNREIYEATACTLHGIGGVDAVDAISMALSRYFETDDAPADNSYYHFPRPVDLSLTTAWNNRTDHLTLLPDSTLLSAN